MRLNLLDSDSFRRVLLNKTDEKIKEFRGAINLLLLHSGSSVLHQPAVVDVSALGESKLSVGHEEEHLSHGEDIYRGSSVGYLLALEFRCHVVFGTTLSR
jgi:hypothetical protein